MAFFWVSTMLRIDVRHNIGQQVKQLAKLRDDVRDKAIAAALNKTTDKARTAMNRQITSEFAIKASDVRAQLSVRKASAKSNRLEATLQAFPRRRGHRSRNVMLFNARPAPGRKKQSVVAKMPDGSFRTMIVPVGGGVTVKIKRNGPRKLIPGAFIGNQGRTVFIRDGKGRLPIHGVETIDVPSMFNTRRLHAAVVKKIQADFPVELARAIKMMAAR